MAFSDNFKGKKGTVFLIGGAGGLVLFLWWKHSQSSAASGASQTASTATASGSDPYPPDGTTGDPSDPNSTDPSTGETYGDEGSSGYGGAGYGDFGLSGYGYGYGQPPGYGSGYPTTGGPGSFTSNAQWAQYAESQLSFADPNAVSAALGKYLTGQGVTSDQENLIDQAIAIAGYPPVSGPGGYPPSIKTTGGGGGGQGKAKNPVSGLKADPGYTSVTVTWSASANATSYLVTASGPGAPASQKVSGTSARIGNLHRNTSYDIRVRAQPGGIGGTDAHVTAKTK